MENNMRFIKQIVAVLALLCASQVFAGLEPGKDYKVLNTPQPTRTGSKIEVLEFFFYGCSHCFKMHPPLTSWEKRMAKEVELVYIPTIFSSSWEPMARTFYSLEILGQQKQLHDELFNAWNVNNIDLRDEAKITEFVGQQGVDRKKFNEAYNSFAMQSKVTRSKQLQQIYGIRATPSFIVDGKYLVSGLGPEETIKVLDALIDKVRRARAGK